MLKFTKHPAGNQLLFSGLWISSLQKEMESLLPGQPANTLPD